MELKGQQQRFYNIIQTHLEKVMDKAQKKNYLVEHRIHIYLIRGLKFIKKIKDM